MISSSPSKAVARSENAGRIAHRQYPAIADLALIGDCRTAALIAKDGTLNWLCVPRFDSPSVFAALLDAQRGGHFTIAPAQPAQISRRYRPETNILETTLHTGGGSAKLTEFMAVASEAEKRRQLSPDHEIIRIIECVEGEVEVQVRCAPRLDYGRTSPMIEDCKALGFRFIGAHQTLALRSELPLHINSDENCVEGGELLRAGERRVVSMGYSANAPEVMPALGDLALAKLDQTGRWWQEWSGQCQYDGPYREMVVRSALVLKLLTFAPSGAVLAAPTTSLPERLGGPRNWDYRYCWLRDATLTLRALIDLGFHDEGTAFMEWMLHATRLTAPHVQVLYNIYGETRLKESTLDHLEGYCQSRPVRIGNGAFDQLQLDVYGEVVLAASDYIERGGRLDRAQGRLLGGIGEVICKLWREPDDGIWEARSGRVQHTYSKIMCWIALDRLVQLHEQGHISIPLDQFCVERGAIEQIVETHGYNPRLGSYVSELDGQSLDASLLQVLSHGYEPASLDRITGTCDRIYERLGRGGLLYRYLDIDDGLPPGEAAFGICSFWGVEALARLGRIEPAAQCFEHICSFANDVGLLSEEIDADDGSLLGNFPQAFTHVGLINAALVLQQAQSDLDKSAIAPPREQAMRSAR